MKRLMLSMTMAAALGVATAPSPSPALVAGTLPRSRRTRRPDHPPRQKIADAHASPSAGALQAHRGAARARSIGRRRGPTALPLRRRLLSRPSRWDRPRRTRAGVPSARAPCGRRGGRAAHPSARNEAQRRAVRVAPLSPPRCAAAAVASSPLRRRRRHSHRRRRRRGAARTTGARRPVVASCPATAPARPSKSSPGTADSRA